MAKVRLGDIATVVTKGTTPTTMGFQFEDGGINFVKIESISEDGTLLKEKFSHISDECNVQMRRSQLQENDILFSIAGAIGRSAIVTKEILPANTNQALAIIRVPRGKIDYNYLLYALSSSAINQQATQHQQGVAQLNISLKNVSDFLLPIYTEARQKQIVHNLKKIDKLISLRKQQLAKLDELVKARFVEMFGEPVANIANWPIERLEKHLTIIGGYAFKSDGFRAKGIPVLRIGNINSGYFQPTNMVYWHDDSTLERYKMHPGDLVISLTGTVGKNDYGNVCILGNDYSEYYLNQRNAKLELNETLNGIYLSELLKFPQIKGRLTGISRGIRQANISNKDILSLPILIPPISLQKQFAAFVERVERQKQTVQQSLEKLELMKKALMQEYFG